MFWLRYLCAHHTSVNTYVLHWYILSNLNLKREACPFSWLGRNPHKRGQKEPRAMAEPFALIHRALSSLQSHRRTQWRPELANTLPTLLCCPSFSRHPLRAGNHCVILPVCYRASAQGCYYHGKIWKESKGPYPKSCLLHSYSCAPGIHPLQMFSTISQENSCMLSLSDRKGPNMWVWVLISHWLAMSLGQEPNLIWISAPQCINWRPQQQPQQRCWDE
jgi:hypothetical protein